MRRTLPAALAMSAILVVLPGCSSSAGGASGDFKPTTPNTLTVATATVPTPGIWEGTADHPTGGFEFGLAKALASRFGLDHVRVLTVKFQRLVGGDLAGADLALSLLTPTAKRDRVLDFSAPYLNVPPAVLARRGIDVPDLKTARGIRWATVRSSTLEQIIDERIQPTKPVDRVGSRPDVLAALADGRADAALFDFPLAVAYAEASPSALPLHVTAKLDRPEQIAAALPQGSGNDEAVDSAIRALTADGTVDRLAARWLGPAAKGGGENVQVIRSSR